MSKHQSGFRAFHSTVTALLEATDSWAYNIDVGNINAVVFLYFKKAFDMVDHEILLSKLHLYGISGISIYTLTDLGDLSNLTGSLSRTIQQYSPPSEWIMCELGVFPIFLENDLLKVDKILGLTFFKARKDLEGFNTAFFNLL